MQEDAALQANDPQHVREGVHALNLSPGRALRRAQESAHLVEEAGPGGLVLQHHMIAAFERDETRAGNSSGQPAAFVEGLHRVAAAVQHEGRDLNARQQIVDIEGGDRAQEVRRVVGRGGSALQLVEPLHLLGGGVRHEGRGEELAERGIPAPPALAHQRLERRYLPVGRRGALLAPAARVAAVEDEMGQALGVAHGVRDRYGATLRDAEQRKPLHAARLDRALEVVDEGFEREVPHVPVGQAVAARIVADEPVVGGHRREEVLPDRAFPIVLEVIEPVGGLDQRRPVADARVGNARAVAGPAELDLLAQGRRRPDLLARGDAPVPARSPARRSGSPCGQRCGSSPAGRRCRRWRAARH